MIGYYIIMTETNNYCCICLSANSGLRFIGCNNGYDLNYEQKIKISASELSKYIDNLADPKFICLGCSGIIELIYQSYKNYYQAKTKLLTYVSKLHKSLQPADVSDSRAQEISGNDEVVIVEANKEDGIVTNDEKIEENINEMIDFTFINVDEEINEIKQEIDIDEHNPDETTEFNFINSDNCTKSENMEINEENNYSEPKNIEIKIENDTFVEENQQEIINNDNENQTSTFTYVCNLCLETFENEFLLTMHIKLHSKSRRFCCNICYKKFKNRHSYDFHMKTHLEEKPYDCTHCEEKFQNEILLKTHKKIHLAQKNFSCDICFKEFKFEGYFKTHMNKHLGQELYKCIICGQKYLKEHYLSIHMHAHTQCKICFKNFKTKFLLDNHMSTVHGEKHV